MKALDPTEPSSVTVHEGRWKAFLLLSKILRKQPAHIFVSEFWAMQQIEVSHVPASLIHLLSQIIQLNTLRTPAIFKYSYI